MHIVACSFRTLFQVNGKDDAAYNGKRAHKMLIDKIGVILMLTYFTSGVCRSNPKRSVDWKECTSFSKQTLISRILRLQSRFWPLVYPFSTLRCIDCAAAIYTVSTRGQFWTQNSSSSSTIGSSDSGSSYCALPGFVAVWNARSLVMLLCCATIQFTLTNKNTWILPFRVTGVQQEIAGYAWCSVF